MKQFKVQLFTASNYGAEQMVLAAARSNSGFAPLTIESLTELGKGMQEQLPQVFDLKTTFELIDNRLHIDCKGLNGWEQAAIIEEVEVFEMPTVNDLNGLFTSTKEEKEEVI